MLRFSDATGALHQLCGGHAAIASTALCATRGLLRSRSGTKRQPPLGLPPAHLARAAHARWPFAVAMLVPDEEGLWWRTGHCAASEMRCRYLRPAIYQCDRGRRRLQPARDCFPTRPARLHRCAPPQPATAQLHSRDPCTCRAGASFERALLNHPGCLAAYKPLLHALFRSRAAAPPQLLVRRRTPLRAEHRSRVSDSAAPSGPAASMAHDLMLPSLLPMLRRFRTYRARHDITAPRWYCRRVARVGGREPAFPTGACFWQVDSWRRLRKRVPAVDQLPTVIRCPHQRAACGSADGRSLLPLPRRWRSARPAYAGSPRWWHLASPPLARPLYPFSPWLRLWTAPGVALLRQAYPTAGTVTARLRRGAISSACVVWRSRQGLAAGVRRYVPATTSECVRLRGRWLLALSCGNMGQTRDAAMRSLLDEAGRDLAGASIASADNIPVSPLLQAAELAERLSEEAAREDSLPLPVGHDHGPVGELLDRQQQVEQSQVMADAMVGADDQPLVAGEGDMAAQPVPADSNGVTRGRVSGNAQPGRSDGEDGGSRGARASVNGLGRTAIEMGYRHQRPPTLAQLRVNTDKSTCAWMRAAVATWPQATNSKTRRDIDADEEEITAACLEGTNATVKTWATRRRTAICFADFLCRTVCRDPREPPPTQGELDRRVRRVFRCMTPDTRSYITLFLEARRRGYPVAGSSLPITVLTLEDYSSALVFLFGEALMEGTSGGPKIVPDCEQRNSEWKQKGVAEKSEEAKVRQQPGTMMGNPMHTDVVKRYKSAAEKDARVHGEQSVTSAPVTAAMMQRLYATLVMSYLPGARTASGSTSPTDASSAAPCGTARPSRTEVPSSLAKCDFIVYCLYAFAWTTLARPFSLISMKHRDVSLPDLSLPRNQSFMNM